MVDVTRYELDDQTVDEISKRFTYHPPKNDQPDRYVQIRERALELALYTMGIAPKSRELSLALTNLEQFVMHANAAIARNE